MLSPSNDLAALKHPNDYHHDRQQQQNVHEVTIPNNQRITKITATVQSKSTVRLLGF